MPSLPAPEPPPVGHHLNPINTHVGHIQQIVLDHTTAKAHGCTCTWAEGRTAISHFDGDCPTIHQHRRPPLTSDGIAVAQNDLDPHRPTGPSDTGSAFTRG